MPAAAWQSQNTGVLADPKDALNVMDFEAAARQALPPAHFGYMATGVDDDATLRANREGFSRFQLRPRRLVDVTRTDLRVEVLGTVLEHPIILAPAGNQSFPRASGDGGALKTNPNDPSTRLPVGGRGGGLRAPSGISISDRVGR
jgi:hypothetical protein